MQQREVAKLAARIASDVKAKDIVVLDMQDVTLIADYFLICSGTSNIHVKNIVDEISETMKSLGLSNVSREGYDVATWVLLDYGSLVVHVFQEDIRSYYDLERLWRDARKVTDWHVS